MQSLFRHQLTLSRLQLRVRAQQPLFKFHLHLALDGPGISPRRKPAGNVEPVRLSKLQQVSCAINRHFSVDRDPECRRRLHPVAVELWRRNSDHRKRQAVEGKTRPDHRRILPVFLLPCRVAHHHNRLRSLPIVRLREHPPRIGANSQHREIISRNVLRGQRLRRLVARVPPDAHQTAPGLVGRHFCEPAGPVAKRLVLLVGEKRPVVLKPSINAAILVVPNSNELTRVGDRQGLQQYGVHQAKDRRGRADSEG